MYYLLGMKQAGWLTRTSQYSTDLSQAAKFEREDAFALIKRHREAGKALIPVRVEDMQ